MTCDIQACPWMSCSGSCMGGRLLRQRRCLHHRSPSFLPSLPPPPLGRGELAFRTSPSSHLPSAAAMPLAPAGAALLTSLVLLVPTEPAAAEVEPPAAGWEPAVRGARLLPQHGRRAPAPGPVLRRRDAGQTGTQTGLIVAPVEGSYFSLHKRCVRSSVWYRAARVHWPMPGA